MNWKLIISVALILTGFMLLDFRYWIIAVGIWILIADKLKNL